MDKCCKAQFKIYFETYSVNGRLVLSKYRFWIRGSDF